MSEPHHRLAVMFQTPLRVRIAIHALHHGLVARRRLSARTFSGQDSFAAEINEHIAERLIRAGVRFVADPQARFVELDSLARNAASIASARGMNPSGLPAFAHALLAQIWTAGSSLAARIRSSCADRIRTPSGDVTQRLAGV